MTMNVFEHEFFAAERAAAEFAAAAFEAFCSDTVHRIRQLTETSLKNGSCAQSAGTFLLYAVQSKSGDWTRLKPGAAQSDSEGRHEYYGPLVQFGRT